MAYASIALAATGPGHTVGVSLFFDSLIRELGLTASMTVALWFHRRRGMAAGLVSAFGAVGISSIPLLIEPLLADLGWRNVWRIERLLTTAVAFHQVNLLTKRGLSHAQAAARMIRAVDVAALPRCFGTPCIGSIRGLVASIGVAATAGGPVPFAAVFERTGSYSPVLLACAVAPLAITACGVGAGHGGETRCGQPVAPGLRGPGEVRSDDASNLSK